MRHYIYTQLYLRKDNQFFRCLGTTVQFWFFELYVHVELPETIKDLSYSGENEEF